MDKKEKEILRKIFLYHERLLSPATLINSIAEHNERLVQSLVAKKYIEEVPRDKIGLGGSVSVINFYRITEKGLMVFASWYKKFWKFFTNDMAKILSIIATILSIIAIIRSF